MGHKPEDRLRGPPCRRIVSEVSGRSHKQTQAHLSALADPDEDLKVHVDESDEGEDTGGEGGVPQQRQGVPEDKGRVPSRLARVNLVNITNINRTLIQIPIKGQRNKIG